MHLGMTAVHSALLEMSTAGELSVVDFDMMAVRNLAEKNTHLAVVDMAAAGIEQLAFAAAHVAEEGCKACSEQLGK